MWIIMNDAFLSVVQNIYDEDELLVRARVEGDIERVFPDAEVFADEGSDYKYRSYLNKREVAKVIEWSVLDIDYGNYKIINGKINVSDAPGFGMKLLQ